MMIITTTNMIVPRDVLRSRRVVGAGMEGADVAIESIENPNSFA